MCLERRGSSRWLMSELSLDRTWFKSECILLRIGVQIISAIASFSSCVTPYSWGQHNGRLAISVLCTLHSVHICIRPPSPLLQLARQAGRQQYRHKHCHLSRSNKLLVLLCWVLDCRVYNRQTDGHHSFSLPGVRSVARRC